MTILDWSERKAPGRGTASLYESVSVRLSILVVTSAQKLTCIFLFVQILFQKDKEQKLGSKY